MKSIFLKHNKIKQCLTRLRDRHSRSSNEYMFLKQNQTKTKLYSTHWNNILYLEKFSHQQLTPKILSCFEQDKKNYTFINHYFLLFLHGYFCLISVVIIFGLKYKEHSRYAQKASAQFILTRLLAKPSSVYLSCV